MIRNPVWQAEYNHLQRSTTLSPQLPHFIGRGLFWMMAILAIIIVGASLARALNTPDTHYMYDVIVIQIVLILAIYTVIYHSRTMVRTWGMASNTILREKEGGNLLPTAGAGIVASMLYRAHLPLISTAMQCGWYC